MDAFWNERNFTMDRLFLECESTNFSWSIKGSEITLDPEIYQPTLIGISVILEKGITLVFHIISVNIDFLQESVTVVNFSKIKISTNYKVLYFFIFASLCMLLTNFVKNSSCLHFLQISYKNWIFNFKNNERQLKRENIIEEEHWKRNCEKRMSGSGLLGQTLGQEIKIFRNFYLCGGVETKLPTYDFQYDCLLLFIICEDFFSLKIDSRNIFPYNWYSRR